MEAAGSLKLENSIILTRCGNDLFLELWESNSKEMMKM